MRSPSEISRKLGDATEAMTEAMDNGSQFSGLTYEEGVEAALRRVAGQTDEDPLSQ